MISDCENCKFFFECNNIDIFDEASFPEDCLDFELSEDEDFSEEIVIRPLFARNLKMLNVLSKCVSGVRGCPYLLKYYVEPQCHYRKGVKYAHSGEIGAMIKDLKTCPWSRKKHL